MTNTVYKICPWLIHGTALGWPCAGPQEEDPALVTSGGIFSGKRSTGKSGGLDSSLTTTLEKWPLIPRLQFPLLEHGGVESEDRQRPFLSEIYNCPHGLENSAIHEEGSSLSGSSAPNISGLDLYTIRSKRLLFLILRLKIFSSSVLKTFSPTKYRNLDIAVFVLNYKHILLARPHEITDSDLGAGSITAQVSHYHSVPDKRNFLLFSWFSAFVCWVVDSESFKTLSIICWDVNFSGLFWGAISNLSIHNVSIFSLSLS